MSDGVVKFTKTAEPDKYSYSGYVILFDIYWTFWSSNSGFDKNVIIFGADMSSRVHVDNKKNMYQFLVMVQWRG